MKCLSIVLNTVFIARSSGIESSIIEMALEVIANKRATVLLRLSSSLISVNAS